jgi:hypothetical protein
MNPPSSDEPASPGGSISYNPEFPEELTTLGGIGDAAGMLYLDRIHLSDVAIVGQSFDARS